MKKAIYIMCMCIFALSMLSGCGGEFAEKMTLGKDTSKMTAGTASGQAVSGQAIHEDEKPAYVKAYMEFLLNADIDPDHDFPIQGYYLLDLNFDNVPELGVLHHSGGSMGGYFTYYYFDGTGIKALLDERGEQARVSNYTQVLADFEQKKVYLLKEMYLLQGNANGTYGYVKEIKSEDQCLRVYDVLDLEVDQERDYTDGKFKDHECEDGFLSDADLEECLVTRRYIQKKWVGISSDEYLKQKRELIPEKNSFIELREGAVNYPGEDNDDSDISDDFPRDLKMEEKEIEQIFKRYANSLKN